MMHISILNRSLKTFVGRLEALKNSYPVTLLSVTALDGVEFFQMRLDVKSDQELAAFAQDAKFGFGEGFKIERALCELSTEYKTEHFVDVSTPDANEDKLFALKERLTKESIGFKALEFSINVDNSSIIRAYASDSQEQEQIARFVS